MVATFLYEYFTVLKEDGQDEKISRQPFYIFIGTVQHVCVCQRFCRTYS
ncbi:conserved hypothetical protein [Xenorhabdus nematophila F1]|uniref:Uncharacterized protein n=1 Tax=Xenorhabdus nematophila (strain ATCC 19061 / DSM 3370 / CCUG 14189 / LMG 1036 / NCIMB 9965 / AN6) TaxID=406817 RepID=D3VCC8_XENNA|nr:hypothetical protein XNC1_1721 [Xenorhabdus nematophila ATCC 19061]CCW31001.1 conserved hypothetical protein [Xenorhabdus nematophila F1]CEF32666.1 hypothetical protein XNW1_4450011 [Xenorhabdus nematophila str. Websteri]CEK22665.1 hypothetical protein XNC2_1671 [Xenorhabdus nematophila AN6/1]